MRVLLALGGNAMTGPDGSATPEDQIAAVGVAMAAVAGCVAAGHEVVITHGNGPQVGNLLVKNELAAAVVPPVPLDWCGAQTQGTLGFILERARRTRSRSRGRRARVRRRSSPAPSSTATTRASPTRPSRSAATCPREEAQALDRARRGLGGPRREGLAARRRLARAARGARRGGGARAARRRLRRRRGRRRRHPRGPRARRPAARRRGGHRQGPHRRPARPAPLGADVLVIATDVDHAVARLRHRRSSASSAGCTPRRDARRTPPRASSRAARWGPRSRRPAGSSSGGGPRASSPSLTTSPTPSRAASAPSSNPPRLPRKERTVPDAIEVRKVPIHTVVRRLRARPSSSTTA